MSSDDASGRTRTSNERIKNPLRYLLRHGGETNRSGLRGSNPRRRTGSPVPEPLGQGRKNTRAVRTPAAVKQTKKSLQSESN